MLLRVYAVAISPVRPSIRPSVTRVDQSKTVEVRIMQFSPYSSPIPVVPSLQLGIVTLAAIRLSRVCPRVCPPSVRAAAALSIDRPSVRAGAQL